MNITLKYDVGTPVWIWRFGQITETRIAQINVAVKAGNSIDIEYRSVDYDTLSPKYEGKHWFGSREAAVEYVQKTVLGVPAVPVPEPPSQGLGTLKDKLLKKLWGS